MMIIKMGPVIHRLKTWPTPFANILSGNKTAEFRKDDRYYILYDLLMLLEYNIADKKYSGRYILAEITDIIHGGIFGIPEGYCMMSLKIIYRDLFDVYDKRRVESSNDDDEE